MSDPGPKGPSSEPALRAIVVFDTRYGNTERVARALAKGLEKAGIDAQCSNIADVDPRRLSDFDLLAVGGPTHYRTASQPMQDFLSSLEGVSLSGKMGFAFDTRKESFWAGSAAKYIERKLSSRGVRMIWPSLSAWVFIPETVIDEEGSLGKEEFKELQRSHVRLGQRMEELFQKTGGEIAKSLVGPDLEASSGHDFVGAARPILQNPMRVDLVPVEDGAFAHRNVVSYDGQAHHPRGLLLT